MGNLGISVTRTFVYDTVYGSVSVMYSTGLQRTSGRLQVASSFGISGLLAAAASDRVFLDLLVGPGAYTRLARKFLLALTGRPTGGI